MPTTKPGRKCQVCETDIGRKYKCPICGEDNKIERSQKEIDSLLFGPMGRGGGYSGHVRRIAGVDQLRPKPPGYCGKLGHSLKPISHYSIATGSSGAFECTNCHSTWDSMSIKPQVVTTGWLRKRDHIAWTIVLENEKPSIFGGSRTEGVVRA